MPKLLLLAAAAAAVVGLALALGGDDEPPGHPSALPADPPSVSSHAGPALAAGAPAARAASAVVAAAGGGVAAPGVALGAAPGDPALDGAPELAPGGFSDVTPWSEPLDRLGDPTLPPPVRATHARLEHRLVTIDLEGAPLAQALEALSRELGVELRVAPEIASTAGERRVDLRLRHVSAHNALSLIVALQEDLAWWVDPDDGAVRVEPRPACHVAELVETMARVPVGDEAPPAEPPPPPALQRRLSVNFPGTPLSEVTMFLSDLTGLQLVLSEEVVDADPEVTFVRRDVPVQALLDEVLGAHGLGLLQQGDILLVCSAQDLAARDEARRAAEQLVEEATPVLGRRVGASGPAAVPTAIELVAAAAGAPWDADAETLACREVVVLPPGCSVEEACERVALATGGAWSLRRGSSPDQPPHALCWREADAGARAALDEALRRWSEGALGAAAREAARRLDVLRATPVLGGPAEVRAARARVRAALVEAFAALSRAACAIDVAGTRDGDVAAHERVAAWADLAAWLRLVAERWAPSCHGRCRNEDPEELEDLRAADACPHQRAQLAALVARWLVRSPLTAADHPGR